MTRFCILFLLFVVLLNSSPFSANAYYVNMPACTVVGQPDFNSVTANQGGSPSANTLNTPLGVFYDNNTGKLLVADSANNRVLIYNSVPQTNNQSADVVIGQPNFTSNSANQGGSPAANTLNNPTDVEIINGKVYVSDTSNNRILVYDRIPDQNNYSASLVIGQVDFTGNTKNQCNCNTPTASSLWGPYDITSDGKKLVVADSQNNRSLIFNTIPNVNNPSADVVLGQSNFTTRDINQGGISASTLSGPYSTLMVNDKLIIGDVSNFRVLVWNTIPTQNKQSADVVIGQPNFTSNGSQVFGFNTRRPFAFAYDGKRFFIAHDFTGVISVRNNGVPTTNFSPQDFYIGFANTPLDLSRYLWEPRGIATAGNKLIVSDSLHYHRLLIFNNDTALPNISLTNSPQEVMGSLRFDGNISTNEPYTISRVEYSLNGGGYQNGIAKDGSFNSVSEDYYLDINTDSNKATNGDGQEIQGYSLQIRGTNNNANQLDNLFYFRPFDTITPEDNTTTTNPYPSFSWSVHQNRQIMTNNLAHYRIELGRKIIRQDKQDSIDWQTHIDNIPVDFSSVKDNDQNLQRLSYQGINTFNGTYENTDSLTIYTQDSSKLTTQSKTKPMYGSYYWRVVAVSKSGTTQQSSQRNLYIQSPQTQRANDFPFALTNISGYGNPKLASFDPSTLKNTYFINNTTPTFYGIATSGSNITLILTNKSCIISSPDCVKIYTTTTNTNSRFGINIPHGIIKQSSTYQIDIHGSKDTLYSQIPRFVVRVGV